MLKNIILVGVGGLAGSITRYLVSVLFAGYSDKIPLSTWIVNIVGSFLIGIIYAISELTPNFVWMRLLLATGFCGGFTTFSAFTSENLNLLQKGEYTLFFFYVSTSILIGILAVLAGILVVKGLK
ncbi:MAG: fluoride efflux transporter CrcB [Bacteroidia bacterium]